VGRGTFLTSPVLGWCSNSVVCRYYCGMVDNVPGCCLKGQTCTDITAPPECTDPGYNLCPGENFCCRTSTFTPMNWPPLLSSFFHF